ncbi:MAG: 2-oxo-4-hydroxy-4-carboxy-5-ureidoimidazoline decarboxylase [Gammaproteobacteria bacterium]|jgi:2-oxo-4-hydroxy-4-carboxy-5-ureidoimidazoline decarboxylase
MGEQISILQLNAVDCDEFATLLVDIFEHSAWIPRRACENRPFASVVALHASLVAIVEASTRQEQLGLLKAHPQLAGKEAKSGELTDLSNSEQALVGMNSLSPTQMQEISGLNSRYYEKFGFPFIIAVRKSTRADIFRIWKLRLQNDIESEIRTCLEQVYIIAELRLADLTGESFN